jgi:type VI secretion system protein ImpB
MGDYSGDNVEDKKSLKDRKFVNIDRDNFDTSMNKIAPKLNFRVDNKLSSEGGEVSVNLQFNSIDDFSPESIANQVEPLRKLIDARNKLRDLMSKADRSEELEGLLEQILQSSDEVSKLSQELGLGKKDE